MASRTIERKIQFFRLVALGGAPADRREYDLARALELVRPLTESPDRYHTEGNRTTSLVVGALDPPKLRLIDVRRDGFPDVERDGVLKPLRLARAAGLAEPVHVVGFQNGVVGAEFNYYGPRLSRLTSYLQAKGAEPAEAEALVDPNVIRRLDQLQEIRLFRIRVDRQLMGEVRTVDRNLHRALVAASTLGDGATVEIVVRATPYKRDAHLASSIKDVIRGLIRRPRIASEARVLRVEGRSEDTGDLLGIDLLSHQLGDTRPITRSRGRTRGVSAAAAYAAIEGLHDELRLDINRAAALSVEREQE